MVTIDSMWLFGALVGAMGIGIGWYIVRLDAMVERLRDEIMRMENKIGSLQNADVNCTRDQDIMKRDMSHIRETMLKMVARRFLRKGLRRDKRKPIA